MELLNTWAQLHGHTADPKTNGLVGVALGRDGISCAVRTGFSPEADREGWADTQSFLTGVRGSAFLKNDEGEVLGRASAADFDRQRLSISKLEIE